jgi:hypothetical protein
MALTKEDLLLTEIKTIVEDWGGRVDGAGWCMDRIKETLERGAEKTEIRPIPISLPQPPVHYNVGRCLVVPVNEPHTVVDGDATLEDVTPDPFAEEDTEDWNIHRNPSPCIPEPIQVQLSGDPILHSRASSSVLQPWINYLPYRQQTVVFCALRGCDGMSKNDPSKFIVRHLRAVVLKDANPRNAFISHRPIPLHEAIRLVAGDIDMYPVHFITHLMHAAEILGFKHPDEAVAEEWNAGYENLCKALHVMSEGPKDLEDRLGATEVG